jgi:hypothetical protein
MEIWNYLFSLHSIVLAGQLRQLALGLGLEHLVVAPMVGGSTWESRLVLICSRCVWRIGTSGRTSMSGCPRATPFRAPCGACDARATRGEWRVTSLIWKDPIASSYWCLAGAGRDVATEGEEKKCNTRFTFETFKYNGQHTSEGS